MSFTLSIRRQRPEKSPDPWMTKLQSTLAGDHPEYPDSYEVYVSYVAFLTAGMIEQHWTEAVRSGVPPFNPRGDRDAFLPDLQRKLRAFRESRHMNGLGSAELAQRSHDVLRFLDEQVPPDALERFFELARTYIRHNESDCLTD